MSTEGIECRRDPKTGVVTITLAPWRLDEAIFMVESLASGWDTDNTMRRESKDYSKAPYRSNHLWSFAAELRNEPKLPDVDEKIRDRILSQGSSRK